MDEWSSFFYTDLGPENLKWLLLNEEPRFLDISDAYQKFCSDDPAEIDLLFNEVAEVCQIYPNLDKEEKWRAMELEDKWNTVLKNKNLKTLRRLVSSLLSISASNAFCESVFSIVNNVFTDEKNRFHPDTLNAFVAIKINSDFDCSEAQELFLSDTNLLNAAKSSEKYVK